MSTAWLSIVGIGEDGLSGLAPIAHTLVDGASVLFGGDRHLSMIPDDHPAERFTWKTPLLDTIQDIRALEGQPVCVLASGDPMSYGIGVTLVREFGLDAITLIPALGAFSLAASKLAWPLEEVMRITLHGRPLELLNRHLQPGARILALSHDGQTPGQVADLLTRTGWGNSKLYVLEHLGGEAETITAGTAEELQGKRFKDLNTIAVDCIPGPGAWGLSQAAGLPDDVFEHDGQLTKQEVRASVIAALAPMPGALLWDIGAGNGSVSIEWMRFGGRAIALEPNAERRMRAARNAAALGVPDLQIIEGRAPSDLADLPSPDAVFVGGGAGTAGVLEEAWAALKPGGRLVANAVTVESETQLSLFFAQEKENTETCEMARIAIARLDRVGPHNGWRPFMPVTQLRMTKPTAPETGS